MTWENSRGRKQQIKMGDGGGVDVAEREGCGKD